MSSQDTERPRVLNSWKEIGAYLGRGVRTVQRWEATMGLPVHRPKGTMHSSVFALAHEIDQWMLRAPSARLERDPAGYTAELRERLQASRLLRQQARELTAQLRAEVREHHEAYIQLKQTLARVTTLRNLRGNGNGNGNGRTAHDAAPSLPANGHKPGSAA